MTEIRPGVLTENREGYSGPELCELAQITYRQLDYWTRTGRLSARSRGSGNPRFYTDRDLAIARYASRLLGMGFGAHVALDLAGRLADGETPLVLNASPLTVQITPANDSTEKESA